MEFLKCKKYSRYEVSREGVVRVAKTKQVLTPREIFGVPYVKITYGSRTFTLKVAYMIASTYLPYERGMQDLKCIDGNWSNYDLSNFEWYNAREEIEKNSEGENWKPIKGFNRQYEICEDGRIRRYSDGEAVSTYQKTDGTLMVKLWKKSRASSYVIAKLVAEHFLDGEPQYNVCYQDGDKGNVHYTNLSWGRPKRKTNHSINRKEPKPIDEYDTNGELVKHWGSMSSAAQHYGITYKTIYYCCNGRAKQGHGSVWRYKGDSFDKYDVPVPFKMLEGEVFRKIPYANRYEVSNKGRMRCQIYGCKLYTPNENGMVRLTIDRKKTTRLLGKLVADTFLPNPGNCSKVNFVDGNPMNCKVENLFWAKEGK